MGASKILVVGDFIYKMYEWAFYEKFSDLGFETEKFEISNYLSLEEENIFLKYYNRFQYKYNYGPSLILLNNALEKKVDSFQPDLVFVYRGKHILPSTLKKIRLKFPDLKIYNYNNDDAFSKKYPDYYWRLFRKNINFYDAIFCYRYKNIKDLRSLGYNNTYLLKPYYIKEFNYQENQEFNSRLYDITFIGHYENDGRDRLIKRLIDENIQVGLFGTGWLDSQYYPYIIQKIGDINRLDTIQYNKVLNNSKMALVFMSKLNNDQYTRRCFEIPAAGAVMVSERTEELMEIFTEGKEIVYFDNEEDLVVKVNRLLRMPEYLESISELSQVRLNSDGHELTDRVREILKIFLNDNQK